METFGSYQLLEQLSFGPRHVQAWIARSTVNDDPCILIRPHYADELGAYFEELLDEWPVFGDPALPSLIERGRIGDQPFAVYDHFAGVTVSTLLEEGPIPAPVAAELARLLVSAVDAAHIETAARWQVPSALRAIEPANVWVCPDGSLRLFGYQFSRLAQRVSALRVTFTRGVFAFMSPEQVLGKFLDYRTDLFSLGSTIYAMYQGRSPFNPDPAMKDIAVLDQIRRVDYLPLSSVVPAAPANLDTVLALCFAEEPDDRFSSARALADTLARIGGGDQNDVAAWFQATAGWMAEVARLDRLGVEQIDPNERRPRADKTNMVLITGEDIDGFFIDRSLVSQTDYARFIQATDRIPPEHWPSGQPPAGLGHAPMTRVRYGEALDYAHWCHKRLPTEEEWQRAALGNHGLLDLSIVWEWTDTWSDEQPHKVVRGGAWRDTGGGADPRNRSSESDRAPDVGFRCAVDRLSRRR